MKLTCLSEGRGGYYDPPCHMLQLCGHRLLLECPVDLSALAVFAPIPAAADAAAVGESSSCDLIRAQPWYKTVPSLHLWDFSLIDAVLVSTPAGMLGLPFLTRNAKFKGKIFATEATARIGRLWMKDFVSMHAEFVQFYGPDTKPGLPHWMKWDELKKLPSALKRIVMGEDGEDLGGWMPSYSAEDIEECFQKIQSLKYGEETCFNGTITLKPYSSGLEIGSCNWIMHGPRRSLTYMSSSVFNSSCAMGFSYCSLQGNDVILFSDLSSLCTSNEACGAEDHSITAKNDNLLSKVSDTSYDNDVATLGELHGTDDYLDENDRIEFICSCVMESLEVGGSVLIPIGRLGTVLLLMEQISKTLALSDFKIPIIMISSVAEEMLAFTSSVPEWLSKYRQEKLFSGEALFGHLELIKEKKLFMFPSIHSSELIMMWQEPCIVFCPHWSLRLGPVVHLLYRWHSDPKCLLIIEKEVDAEVALLPFRPLAMKVLQCSFLSGIMVKKVQPLLEMLKPKLILFPEGLRTRYSLKHSIFSILLYYSTNVQLRVPSFKGFEILLEKDLAFQLKPKKLNERNLAIARLTGKMLLSNGKYFLVAARRNPERLLSKQSIHWGSIDIGRLLLALQERGIMGSLETNAEFSNGVWSVHVTSPSQALIESSDWLGWFYLSVILYFRFSLGIHSNPLFCSPYSSLSWSSITSGKAIVIVRFLRH